MFYKQYNYTIVQNQFRQRLKTLRDKYIVDEYIPQKLKTAYSTQNSDDIYRYSILYIQYLNAQNPNIEQNVSDAYSHLILYTDSNTANTLQNFLKKFYTDDSYRSDFLSKAKIMNPTYLQIQFTAKEMYDYFKWVLSTIDLELAKFDASISYEDRNSILRNAISDAGLKPQDIFKCSLCGASFQSERALENHTCSAEPLENEYSYVCSLCGFKTNSLNEFNHHKCTTENRLRGD